MVMKKVIFDLIAMIMLLNILSSKMQSISEKILSINLMD